jgi:endosialidase-like protein
MSTGTRLAACLFVLFSSVVFADRPDTASRSPLITAAAAGERVRFSAPGTIAKIRVQIRSITGEALFDSAWKDGNVLDWPIESLADGSYRCTVTIKDLDGQVMQKETALLVRAGEIVIEPGADNENYKVTLLAHDGANGAIVSTSGDLSFRFGDFLAGKDSERMRLTAEGNLGVGTDKPQAPLDVNGLIRTSKGIVFSDGTILNASGGEVVIQKAGGANANPTAAGGGLLETALRSQPAAIPRRSPAPNAAPDFQFKVDAAGVHVGTTNAFGLTVAGDATLSSNLVLPATDATGTVGLVTVGTNRFIHNFGTNNAFVGIFAGNLTMTGGDNAGMGNSALQANGAGTRNTATGSAALFFNSAGNNNTATGTFALFHNTTGIQNTVIGASAMFTNSTGSSNTAIGYSALTNVTGSGNIALGLNAGKNLTTETNAIEIGNVGLAGDSATIRIGTNGTQLLTFLAGVRGTITSLADALPVMVDSAGQLGTVSSSASVKRDIAGVGEESAALLKLRPVSFFYTNDAVGIRQYGLIAEEVAQVMPELVQRSCDGTPETVRYHFLAPLLVNEAQRQERRIEELELRVEQLEKLLRAREE